MKLFSSEPSPDDGGWKKILQGRETCSTVFHSSSHRYWPQMLCVLNGKQQLFAEPQRGHADLMGNLPDKRPTTHKRKGSLFAQLAAPGLKCSTNKASLPVLKPCVDCKTEVNPSRKAVFVANEATQNNKGAEKDSQELFLSR